MGRILKRRPGYTDFIYCHEGKNETNRYENDRCVYPPKWSEEPESVCVFCRCTGMCRGGGCYTPGRQRFRGGFASPA